MSQQTLGNFDWSEIPAELTTQPSTSASLTATAVSPTEIDLNWENDDPNATAIQVLWSTGGAPFQALPPLDGTSSGYPDTGLTPNTLYSFEVITEGPSGSSSIATAQASTPSVDAPSGLAATGVSTSEIDLQWTNNSTTATGIEIDRSSNGGPFAPIVTGLPPDTTSYPDTTGLQDNTQYSYEVKATGGSSGDSSFSPPASAWTFPVVTSLQATAVSTSEIDLAWACDASSATGFDVQQSTDGGKTWGAPIPLSGATVNQYQDLGLQADSDLFFRVRAELPSGPSNYSDDVEMSTLPATPAAPTVTLNGDEINLQWPAASTNDTGIILERSTDGTDYSPVATDGDMGPDDALDPTATGYTDSNISDGTTFWYQYFLQNIGGLSAACAAVSITVPINAPSDLTATVPPSSSREIDLAWTNNSDTARVQVQVSSDGQNFGTAAFLATPATSYVWIDDDAPGSQWFFRVVADNGTPTSPASEVSAPSNVASATTAAALYVQEAENQLDGNVGQSYPFSVTPYYESALPNPFSSMTISWGDGTSQVVGGSGGAFNHSYGEPGGFHVEVSGATAAGPVGSASVFNVGTGNPSAPPFPPGQSDVLHLVSAGAPTDSNPDDGEATYRQLEGPAGALVPVDNTDSNDVGIPDFATFYQDPPSTPPAGSFVPLNLILDNSASYYPNLQVVFSYSASDPAAVTVTGSGARTDPYVYHPAPGSLRIWDDPGTNRTESNYIVPGQAYSLGSIVQQSNLELFSELYVEAVAPSKAPGDLTIGVQLTYTAPDGTVTEATDSVNCTAIETGVAVDANRDETIKFDGSDVTSAADPYQFWLNDNTDSAVFPPLKANQPIPTAANYLTSVGGVADSRYGRIMNQSDLEDYAHMEIQVPLGATNGSGVLSAGWSATIQYTSTTSFPSIDLYALPAADAASLLTYMNDPTAAAALGGTPVIGQTYSGERAIGSAGGYDVGTVSLPAVPGTEVTGAGGDYLNYLFDGVTAGSGAVTVRWLYNGQAVVQNSFNLQLQTIGQMYEQASVINPAWIVNDTANGLGDLRRLPAGTISSTATIINAYSSSSPLDDQVVVFVPGWRMKISEMEDYADTTFKRLYWQGYTGRFVVFDWPTEWVDTGNYVNALADPTNFDRSLQKALNSAPALYNLLASLDGQYGYQNVDIFAHSMGNFVVSEALRIAAAQAPFVPVANTYISTQSAVPAEAYDPTGSNSGSLWANFMGQSYYANLSDFAVQNMYNFYNPNDRALTHAQAWPLNNFLKPDSGYDVQYPFNRTANYEKWDSHVGYVLMDLSDPLQRYEALAFAARSGSGAVGATANVGGPFNAGKQVNLNTQFGFSTDHSGEFDGTESWRRAYWNTMMIDFNLTPWSL